MAQGDQEKALGLPVSPLMDREQAGGMTRSQVSAELAAPAATQFRATVQKSKHCAVLVKNRDSNSHDGQVCKPMHCCCACRAA